MRIRQFLAISTTCYIAATYILCTIPTTFKILQKATKAASFCHKTGVFAPRKWVSCQQQLHELSPKSGASARKNQHARIRNHPIPPPPRPTSGFLKVKICSRNRRFSARVCNAVARARRSPHATYPRASAFQSVRKNWQTIKIRNAKQNHTFLDFTFFCGITKKKYLCKSHIIHLGNIHKR